MKPECPFCQEVLKPIRFKENMVEVTCNCGKMPITFIAIDTTVIFVDGNELSSMEEVRELVAD